MIKILALSAFIAIACALDCTNLATGYYCNADLSYTLCVNGYGYVFSCAAGTGCECGTGVNCATPCTFTCEPGSSPAQPFCQQRINEFGTQGYFCQSAGGFYQCVRDAYCSDQASPRSQFIPCPDGTECRCGNSFEECSSSAEITPCVWPVDYQPYTTGSTTGTTGTTGSPPAPTHQSPHQASLCGSYRWDCINFSQGYSAHFCTDNTCGNVGQDGFCAWDADTNEGSCGGDIACYGAQSCNTASNCGSPDSWVCAINTCCGVGGVCIPVCSQ